MNKKQLIVNRFKELDDNLSLLDKVNEIESLCMMKKLSIILLLLESYMKECNSYSK